MPRGKARYGVDSNPFTPGRPLDPLHDSGEAATPLSVDGFKSLTEIREKMQTGRDQGLPIFIFLSGPKGAGRRSMENAIFQLWCEMGSVEPKRFARVGAKAKSESPLDLMRDWLGELVVRLKLFDGLPVEQQRINELQSAIGLNDLVQIRVNVQAALPVISGRMLMAKPSPFEIGASFTDVRRKMVDEVCALFRGLPKVCVLTLYEERLDRLQIDTDGLTVVSEMGSLTKDEIAQLIAARWGKDKEVPFDIAAVQEFFTHRYSYIGLVLQRLGSLFEHMCAAHADEGGVWPDDRKDLYYGPDRVKATLELIEREIVLK